jgi:hypothetical protein
MKKRKSPIVLATVLVILLVAVGIIYSPRTVGDGHGPEVAQQAPPPNAEQGDRPKLSASDVSSMASSSMAARPKPAMVASEAGGPGGSGPTISVPKFTESKPTPNESSISNQWYTDQTKK